MWHVDKGEWRGDLPFAHGMIVLDEDLVVVLFAGIGHGGIRGADVLGHFDTRTGIWNDEV